MNYTAEQLRDMVSLIEEQEVPADGQRIKMLRAFADALEENVRLKEQMSDLHTGYTTTLKELTADRDSWRGQADMHSETAHKQMQRADGLQAELAKLRQAIELAAHTMGGEGVNDQEEALDEGLRILDAARAAYPKE